MATVSLTPPQPPEIIYSPIALCFICARLRLSVWQSLCLPAVCLWRAFISCWHEARDSVFLCVFRKRERKEERQREPTTKITTPSLKKAQFVLFSLVLMHKVQLDSSRHARVQTQLKEPPVNDPLTQKNTHTCLNRPPFHTNNKPSQTLVSYVRLTKKPSLLPFKPPPPPDTQQTSHSFPEKTFDCANGRRDKET